MKIFSLRAMIDDIMLIVRNNNISESEDLSRAQIAGWILAYKNQLKKEKRDKDEASGADEDEFDESEIKIIGPLELKTVDQNDESYINDRITVDEITDLLDNDPDNIIAVFDQRDCIIQQMHGYRRHFHFFRKYTSNELTYDYEQKHIIVKGGEELQKLTDYIWVKYIASGEGEDEDDEDIVIPSWMIPEIKRRIFANELSFMIKMPSDDDNNSTLDGIKPHGPQDQEK